MSSSSSDPQTGAFLPGNARVVMNAALSGTEEMTIHQIEGNKAQALDEETEVAFWSRVRSKAQAKAKEIIAQAMAEAEAIREQARQQGLGQGLEDARHTCDAQFLAMGESLSALLAGLEAERLNLWARHRQEFTVLLKLAVEKTLHTELSIRRQEILAGLMDQAVDILDTRTGFTVLVHPGDEASTTVLLEEARRAHPGLGPWRLKTDTSITPGGVRLESESGMVDNTVDTRFEQIADLLSRVEFSEGQP